MYVCGLLINKNKESNMKKGFLGLMAATALLFSACEDKVKLGPNDVQLPDNTDVTIDPANEDYTRMVMLEQFTGQGCGYCPMGADTMKAGIAMLSEADQARVIWTAHHSGFGQDEYTISNSTSMNSYLGITGAPAVVIDRMETTIDYRDSKDATIIQPVKSFVHTPTGFVAEGFGDFLKSELANEGEASVNIKTHLEGNTLKVTVYGAVKEVQNIRVTAYVQENGLVGQQYDYRKPTNEQLVTNYVHNHVPRAFMSVTLGDELKLTGKVYSKTYSIEMKSAWKAANCEVVAFVTKSENYRPVLNAAAVPVK